MRVIFLICTSITLIGTLPHSVFPVTQDLDFGFRAQEFATIFEQTLSVESQSLLGFNSWLVDPVLVGSFSGPTLRVGRNMIFRVGPFGTVRSSLIPISPLAVDTFAVGRYGFMGYSRFWRTPSSQFFNYVEHSDQSPWSIRYRVYIGGDTGDPLIHRYTQPGLFGWNRDKIGPTHSLYISRKLRFPSGVPMLLAVTCGERRYSTLTPENQHDRERCSISETFDWNQQRWGGIAVSHQFGAIEAGYLSFKGWEFFPNLGFDLPVKGWTAAMGADLEFPIRDHHKSHTIMNWSSFSVKHDPILGVPEGQHRYWDLSLRHHLHYHLSQFSSIIFDQGINGEAIRGSTITSPFTNLVYGNDVKLQNSHFYASYRLSLQVFGAEKTATEHPKTEFIPSVSWQAKGWRGLGFDLKTVNRSRNNNSLIGLQFGSYLRPTDQLFRYFGLWGTEIIDSRFFIHGNPNIQFQRIFIGKMFIQADRDPWKYYFEIELSSIPRKIMPVNRNYLWLGQETPVRYICWYNTKQQNVTVFSTQLHRDIGTVFGGRIEYRNYQSRNGVNAGIPRHRVLGELQIRIQTGLKASLTWQGYSSSDWSDMVAGDNTELPAWGVWALSVSQTVFRGKLEGTVRVWNLMDQLIRTHPLGPMRPRRLELAIQLMIG